MGDGHCLVHVGDVLLDGRYTLRSILGSGSSARVWSAWDNLLSREVAIKVLRNDFFSDPEVELLRVVSTPGNPHCVALLGEFLHRDCKLSSLHY